MRAKLLLLSFSRRLSVVTRGDLVRVADPRVPTERSGGVAEVEGPLFQTLGDVGRCRDFSCRFEISNTK